MSSEGGGGEARERKAVRKAPTERAQVSGSNRDGEDGFSVLDVIKAIAPLLIIIGLAFAMLVLGYLFLPPNLSSSFFESTLPAQSLSSSATPSATKEAQTLPSSEPVEEEEEEDEDEEILICEEINDVKEVISALKDITEWRELGSRLGVLEEQLEAIDGRNEDRELKKRAMLRLWFEMHVHQTPFCWVEVLDALLALGHNTVAKKIARKYDILWVE